MVEWVLSHWYIVIACWMVLGIISWGWQNHCAYENNTRANYNPRKWTLLYWSPVYGPLMAFMMFSVGLIDRKWYFGLRFK